MNGVRQARGAALILVLWLVAALSLVVLAGARGARLHTQRVAVDVEQLRAQSDLDAAVQMVAVQLMQERALADGYRRLHLRLGDTQAWVEVVPSAGLVDVNVASRELLETLLQRVGHLSPGEATVLTSRIRDFIDPDDTPDPLGGAERAQYAAAGQPIGPRNASLDDLSDLRFVLGMTGELYAAISPFLGLNGQQRIDINAAPPALVDALSGQPGLGAGIQAAPPEMRAGALPAGASGNLFASAGVQSAQSVRVRALVQTQPGRWWERQVWLDLATRPDAIAPWTTLSVESVRRVTRPEQLIHDH